MNYPDLPDQPDGICAEDPDDHRLPDPLRAAERVMAYVAECGDGLYDQVDGQPLYARDLESLGKAVQRHADNLRRHVTAPDLFRPDGTAIPAIRLDPPGARP